METIFLFLVFLFSIIFHEIAHGLMAESLGDPTARQLGRISLNPLKHLDPFGSVVLPLMTFFLTAGNGPIFGYAKPVPVNPLNFREPKKGMFFVSLAGPGANILLATFFALIIRFFSSLPLPVLQFFATISFYNFFLALFNLFPIFPFDGFHVLNYLLEKRFARLKFFLIEYHIFLLLLFLFFGLNYVALFAYLIFHLISGQ